MTQLCCDVSELRGYSTKQIQIRLTPHYRVTSMSQILKKSGFWNKSLNTTKSRFKIHFLQKNVRPSPDSSNSPKSWCRTNTRIQGQRMEGLLKLGKWMWFAALLQFKFRLFRKPFNFFMTISTPTNFQGLLQALINSLQNFWEELRRTYSGERMN